MGTRPNKAGSAPIEISKVKKNKFWLTAEGSTVADKKVLTEQRNRAGQNTAKNRETLK
jgi:hypothetical protein